VVQIQCSLFGTQEKLFQERQFSSKTIITELLEYLFYFFSPHPNGVECLDITPDGKYIVTVSKEV